MGDTKEGSPEHQWAQGLLVPALRWALRHLYDPDALGRSPLVALFGLDAERDPLALQRALLGAIEALRPQGSLPRQARAWRAYRALYHRYGEQFTQAEVARALGLSKRQMHRQEIDALQALAAHLWAKYDLQAETVVQGLAPRRAPVPPRTESPTPSREEELRRLEASLPDDSAMADEVLLAALRVADPLAQGLRVRLEWDLPAALSSVAVPRSLVRQAVLNALTAAIRAVPGGCVHVLAHAGRARLHIEIQPSGAGQVYDATGQPLDENLEMARRLMTLCGGSLEVAAGEDEDRERPYRVRLVVPSAIERTVLVIDDNEDALRLFERYLAGTHYEFVGTRDPQRLLALASKLRPEVIVLDVMLPGIDGWELLGNLRQDPDTQGIPVVVCSILPEEPLALALGAAAFLRKPVSQVDFVTALDRQVGRQAREPGE